MADVTGARGTGNITQGLRKVDMSEKILLLEPSSYPFTMFSKRAAKKVAVNSTFQWAEDILEPRFDATSGAVASTTTTTIPVNNGAYFAEHDVFADTATNELMRVQAVAGNNLIVVRGAGGSTAVNVGSGDELMILGSAQPEGDTSKPARSLNATTVTNYTQIFRAPVELTETQRNSDLFVEEDDEAYQKMKKGIEHAKDIEEHGLFGGSSIDTTGSQPRRQTKGLTRFISTNVTAVGGTLSESSFFGALRPAFRYGSKRKLAMASGLAVDVLNTYARAKIQVTDQGRTAYGVNVVDYISPHGTLTVARHDLLEGTKWGKAIIGVDLEQVKYRYIRNRDTSYLPDRQAPDADTKKGEYLSECGFQIGLEKTHFLMTGITG